LNKRGSKAFTLIEVLISSLLICIFAGSLTYLLRAGIYAVRSSRLQTKQTMMVKSIMEGLRATPFNELYSYNGSSFDNGRGRVSVIPSGNDLVVISAEEGVKLVTLRSRYQ